MRLLLGLLAAVGIAGSAVAGDLTVTVRTPAGRPVSQAVVNVYPASGGASRLTGPYSITQHDMMFDPLVTVVPVGAEVSFPNLDTVRHHVYSFSAARTFELQLYSRGAAPMVKFDKAGVVSIGCNIHDAMLAFVYVTDAPFAVKTNAQGIAVIRGVPAGAARIRTWHPYGKPRDGRVEQNVTVAAVAQSLPVTLDVRPAPMSHGAY